MATSPPAPCYFLRIPKEIRLCIYRELLLPDPKIYLGKGESDIIAATGSDEDWEDEDDGYDEDDFDIDGYMEWIGGDSSSDVSMRGGGREYITAKEAAADAFEDSDEDRYRRYPAILAANKQIYSEASAVLYTEGIIVVEAGDVVCLAQNPYNVNFGIPYSKNWRHNPLHGLGKEVDGVVTYDTATMGGKMDPHVFARFQKVYFDANFDVEHTQAVELWIDDDTHVVRADDAETYKELVRGSTVMTDFVELISKSPLITSLEMSLEVEIMANSHLMQGMGDEEDEDEETEVKLDTLMDIADERATELFLDSGVCECLKGLSNVKNFTFSFGFHHRMEEDKYQPLPRHVAMIRGLKGAIEGNFPETMVEVG